MPFFFFFTFWRRFTTAIRLTLFTKNGGWNSHSHPLQPQRSILLRHSPTSISNIPPRAAGNSRAGTRVPSHHRCPQGAKGLPELPHAAALGWFRRRRRGTLVCLLSLHANQTLSLSLIFICFLLLLFDIIIMSWYLRKKSVVEICEGGKWLISRG